MLIAPAGVGKLLIITARTYNTQSAKLIHKQKGKQHTQQVDGLLFFHAFSTSAQFSSLIQLSSSLPEYLVYQQQVLQMLGGPRRRRGR